MNDKKYWKITILPYEPIYYYQIIAWKNRVVPKDQDTLAPECTFCAENLKKDRDFLERCLNNEGK